MKLRNKKTGKIEECVVIPIDSNGYPNEYEVFEKGDSLAELNAEWEDVPEEPKKYWYINASGEINSIYEEDEEEEDTKLCKEIGNYFETREEAEQAVEKLKAVKRLKDKGFKLKRWKFLHDRPGVWIQADCIPDTVEELDLLFGGEE